MGYSQVIEASEQVFAAFEVEAAWSERIAMADQALRALLDALDGAAWEASRDPDVQRRFVRLAQHITGALVGVRAELGEESGQEDMLDALNEGLAWAMSGALLPAGAPSAETGPGVELEAVAAALEAGDLDEVVARGERELAANPVAMTPTLLLASAYIAGGDAASARALLDQAQSRWPSRLAGLLLAMCALIEDDVDAAIRAAIDASYGCLMLCPHGFSSLPCVVDADEDGFLHAAAQALGDEVLVQLGVAGGASAPFLSLLDALLRVQPWEAFEELGGLTRWGHALPDAERAAAHLLRARLARYFNDLPLHAAELEVARGLGAPAALLEREVAGAARDRGFEQVGLVEITGFGDHFSMARTQDNDIVSGITFAERLPSAARAAERMVRALGHLADAGYKITVLDAALQPPWDAARAAREEALAEIHAWEADGGWSLERLEAVEAALEEGDADALDAALAGLPDEDAAAPVIAAWAATLREDWAAARRALLTRQHLWAARVVEAVAELADEEDPTDMLLDALGAGPLWSHTLLGDAPVAADMLPAPGPLAAQALSGVMEAAADAALDLMDEIGWMDARGAIIQAILAPAPDACIELCAEYLADPEGLSPEHRATLLCAMAHWTRQTTHELEQATGWLQQADAARPGWPPVAAELAACAAEAALHITPALRLTQGTSAVELELDEDGRRHERWTMSDVALTRTAEPTAEQPGPLLIQLIRELITRGMRPDHR